MSTSETRETLRLDKLSLKAVELYQNQLALTDRILSYFSQYSVLLLIVSGVLYGYRESVEAYGPALFIPPLVYVVMAYGNYKGLAPTLDELWEFRNIAAGMSRIPLTGNHPARIKLFHVLSTALVLGIYAAAWASAVWK